MMALEDILKDKEELINTMLKLLEGREARATLDLDGISFKLGKSTVAVNGKLQLTFIPVEKIKK